MCGCCFVSTRFALNAGGCLPAAPRRNALLLSERIVLHQSGQAQALVAQPLAFGCCTPEITQDLVMQEAER